MAKEKKKRASFGEYFKGVRTEDVYKRQVPYLILNHQHTDFFKLLAQFLDVRADNPVINVHIAPVSYTHLDVYKRQTTRSLWRSVLPPKRSTWSISFWARCV